MSTAFVHADVKDGNNEKGHIDAKLPSHLTGIGDGPSIDTESTISLDEVMDLTDAEPHHGNKIFVPLQLKKWIILHLDFVCRCHPFIDAKGRQMYRAQSTAVDPMTKASLKIYPVLTADLGLQIKFSIAESSAALSFTKNHPGTLKIYPRKHSIVCLGLIPVENYLYTLKLILPKNDTRQGIVGNLYRKKTSRNETTIWKIVIQPNLK